MRTIYIFLLLLCCLFSIVSAQEKPSLMELRKKISHLSNYNEKTYNVLEAEVQLNEYLKLNDEKLSSIEKIKILAYAGRLFSVYAKREFEDDAKNLLYYKKACEIGGLQLSIEKIDVMHDLVYMSKTSEKLKNLISFNSFLNWLRLMPKEELQKYMLFSENIKNKENEMIDFCRSVKEVYEISSENIADMLLKNSSGEQLLIENYLPTKWFIEKKLKVKLDEKEEKNKTEEASENKGNEIQADQKVTSNNFKVVLKISKSSVAPLSKENLVNLMEYLKDERIVGLEGLSDPKGLDFFNKKRICDYAVVGIETYLNGDYSYWHQNYKKTKNLQPTLESFREKMEKYQKLSIQEIGVLEISAAVNEKKYSTDEDWVKLSRLLVRWLNYDFEFYNRAAYQNANRELMLNEIRKWWGENKGLDKDAWVKNAEKMQNSELYTKIRNECLALGEKRAKEWQEKRKKELENFKQNDPEFLPELEKLEKTTGTKEGKEKAIEWLEKNKSKLAGTTLEAEMTQVLKRFKEEILEETNP